ncbi:MAG: PaaI family thioesterase [Burkholderiaceae bacterium]
MAYLQQRIDGMFSGLLGVKLESVSPDRLVASMLVRPDLCTIGDTLHGGAFMAFADTMGAVATLVNLPPGHRTTTLESKTNFLGGAAAGTRVTSETTPFHKGRSTQVWQTRISNADGKLCAVVTQTQMVIASR